MFELRSLMDQKRQQDQKTLAILNQSLQKLTSISYDGKTSFENQIKIMKQTQAKLINIITRYKQNRQFREERKKDRQKRMKEFSQTQLKITNLEKEITKLKQDNRKMETKRDDAKFAFQTLFKEVYRSPFKIVQDQKTGKKYFDYLEFQVLQEHKYLQFQQDYERIFQDHQVQKVSQQTYEQSSLAPSFYDNPDRQPTKDRLQRMAYEEKHRNRRFQCWQAKLKFLQYQEPLDKIDLNSDNIHIKYENLGNQFSRVKMLNKWLVQIVRNSIKNVQDDKLKDLNDPQVSLRMCARDIKNQTLATTHLSKHKSQTQIKPNRIVVS